MEALSPRAVAYRALDHRLAFTTDAANARARASGSFTEGFLRRLHQVLPDLVAYRRLHENNTGVKNLGNLSERMRVLKASLDRRRAAGQKLDDE